MRLRIFALLLVSVSTSAPLAAQAGSASPPAPQLKLAAGAYKLTSRDSTRPFPPDITMLLHEDGTFEINAPGEPILGAISQKDGVLSWVEPRCPETGTYTVRATGKGFWLDVKEDGCDGRKGQLGLVLFTPAQKP